MSYSAQVFNIMIASPSDVTDERNIAREVINEWNNINSETRGIVLLPLSWETHSSPEQGSHPQKIINSQVLGKSDLLIGIFKSRIGSPTENYSSGTIEEIKEHEKSGKLAMLYFSTQDIPRIDHDANQLEQLDLFKTTCQLAGLYTEYCSLDDFRRKLTSHLQLKVNDHEMFKKKESKGINSVIYYNSNEIELSQEAKELLKNCSLDRDGQILKVVTMGGTSIGTNRKEFVQNNERREIAKWESAINELLTNDLIEEKGYKGEVFKITKAGYDLADKLEI